MADIRINALATTATTPASDDYLALDGTAQGTRKILATNIANNVTDVILGTSGPSVKSSLSARAPRQGLVFDGSGTKATVTVPAFGTGDFTASAWIREDNSFAGTPVVMIGSGTGGFYMEFDANGFPYVAVQGGAGVLRKATTACVVKKLSLITYVKTSGTGIWYVNGIAAGSAADSNNYTGGIAALSDIAPYNLTGYVFPLIYNRALSASEVVALYEAGAPAASEFGSPAAGNAVSLGAAPTYYGTLVIGKRYRYAITVSSYVSGNVRIGDGTTFHLDATANGTYTGDFVATGVTFNVGGTYSATISGVSCTAIGLLLAPDAAQAGGGLVWYDTSGNAANITLPASGVSWNVPFGNNIAASGTNQNITLTPSGTGVVRVPKLSSGATDFSAVIGDSFVSSSGSGRAKLLVGTSAADAEIFVGQGSNNSILLKWVYNATTASAYGSLGTYAGNNRLVLQGDGGNVLIGTTSNTGEKLQVNGTGYFSGNLTVGSGSGTIRLAAGDGSKGQYTTDGTNTYLDYIGSIAIRSLPTYNPALTLDSSQNATFAGNIKTAAPSGGTAATWRLGTVASVSPTSPNRTIEVEIGGTTYYIHAKTTND